MKNLMFILVLLINSVTGCAQLKLTEIPYSLDSINRTNAKGKYGVWYTFDKLDSCVFGMWNFREGKLEGPFTRYWRNGNPSEQGFYKDGNLHGQYIAYWEDGTRRADLNYLEGNLDGLAKSYDRNGTLISRAFYSNGILDSNHKDNFTNPALIIDGQGEKQYDTTIFYFKTKWNRRDAVYRNDTLIIIVDYLRNRIKMETYFSDTILVKRIIYHTRKWYKFRSDKKPQVYKIYYFNKEGDRTREEGFNRKGQPLR